MLALQLRQREPTNQTASAHDASNRPPTPPTRDAHDQPPYPRATRKMGLADGPIRRTLQAVVGSVSGLRNRPRASARPPTAALLVFCESSHGPGVIASGVTQPPRWRSCGGCSSAQKKVEASRIRASSCRGLGDYQHVGLVDEDFRTALANRASAAAEPTLRRPVSRGRRLRKQASGSRLVRRRAAAHQRRPAVIWRADVSFRVPASDRCSDAAQASGSRVSPLSLLLVEHCERRDRNGYKGGVRRAVVRRLLCHDLDHGGQDTVAIALMPASADAVPSEWRLNAPSRPRGASQGRSSRRSRGRRTFGS
jgi:hypothetical protein